MWSSEQIWEKDKGYSCRSVAGELADRLDAGWALLQQRIQEKRRQWNETKQISVKKQLTRSAIFESQQPARIEKDDETSQHSPCNISFSSSYLFPPNVGASAGALGSRLASAAPMLTATADSQYQTEGILLETSQFMKGRRVPFTRFHKKSLSLNMNYYQMMQARAEATSSTNSLDGPESLSGGEILCSIMPLPQNNFDDDISQEFDHSNSTPRTPAKHVVSSSCEKESYSIKIGEEVHSFSAKKGRTMTPRNVYQEDLLSSSQRFAGVRKVNSLPKIDEDLDALGCLNNGESNYSDSIEGEERQNEKGEGEKVTEEQNETCRIDQSQMINTQIQKQITNNQFLRGFEDSTEQHEEIPEKSSKENNNNYNNQEEEEEEEDDNDLIDDDDDSKVESNSIFNSQLKEVVSVFRAKGSHSHNNDLSGFLSFIKDNEDDILKSIENKDLFNKSQIPSEFEGKDQLHDQDCNQIDGDVDLAESEFFEDNNILAFSFQKRREQEHEKQSGFPDLSNMMQLTRINEIDRSEGDRCLTDANAVAATEKSLVDIVEKQSKVYTNALSEFESKMNSKLEQISTQNSCDAFKVIQFEGIIKQYEAEKAVSNEVILNLQTELVSLQGLVKAMEKQLNSSYQMFTESQQSITERTIEVQIRNKLEMESVVAELKSDLHKFQQEQVEMKTVKMNNSDRRNYSLNCHGQQTEFAQTYSVACQTETNVQSQGCQTDRFVQSFGCQTEINSSSISCQTDKNTSNSTCQTYTSQSTMHCQTDPKSTSTIFSQTEREMSQIESISCQTTELVIQQQSVGCQSESTIQLSKECQTQLQSSSASKSCQTFNSIPTSNSVECQTEDRSSSRKTTEVIEREKNERESERKQFEDRMNDQFEKKVQLLQSMFESRFDSIKEQQLNSIVDSKLEVNKLKNDSDAKEANYLKQIDGMSQLIANQEACITRLTAENIELQKMILKETATVEQKTSLIVSLRSDIRSLEAKLSNRRFEEDVEANVLGVLLDCRNRMCESIFSSVSVYLRELHGRIQVDSRESMCDFYQKTFLTISNLTSRFNDESTRIMSQQLAAQDIKQLFELLSGVLIQILSQLFDCQVEYVSSQMSIEPFFQSQLPLTTTTTSTTKQTQLDQNVI